MSLLTELRIVRVFNNYRLLGDTGMEKTGILRVMNGSSRLEGTLLARDGEDDPLAAATRFLQNRGFVDDDLITVTGTVGSLGSESVIFITRSTAVRYRKNRTEQHKAGIKRICISLATLGAAGLFMFIAWSVFGISAAWGFVVGGVSVICLLIALGVGMEGLSIFFFGVADEGGPGFIVIRQCPNCYVGLSRRDLPAPGLTATCPHCFKPFTREDWE